jgi:subtilisin family serine protease
MLNGISFACPQVAALASLLFDAFPTKTATQIRDRIITTRGPDFTGTDSAGQAYQYAGCVRFHNALAPGW